MEQNLPLEIERKYLIKYPDILLLQKAEAYNRSHITQTYLNSEGSSFGGRVRKRQSGGSCTYTHTLKRTISAIKRVEIEKEISEEEYNVLLKSADQKANVIDKVRHCFLYGGKLFELDTYPFWNDRATLEIELEDENETVVLPAFIEVIKEVTDDPRYRNRSLSLNIITELI